MEFFDCNCGIGKTAVMNPLVDGSLSGLKQAMERCGVQTVLAYHLEARDTSPMDGNRIISRLAEQEKWIRPLWVAMPHHTGEFPNPGELLREMKQNDVRGIRIFPHPDFHNYGTGEYTAGELFSAMEHAGVPVFMDLDQAGWDGVDDILERHHSLKLILCNTGYRCDRYLYPLVKKHGYLHIETSRYIPHQGIEHLVAHMGHERILFGSGMPEYAMGAAVYHVEKLMLEEHVKQAIAGGNLARLLEGVCI
ncbi:MAG: amidohydrolase family protein [Clostridia bacterium]